MQQQLPDTNRVEQRVVGAGVSTCLFQKLEPGLLAVHGSCPGVSWVAEHEMKNSTLQTTMVLCSEQGW